YQPGARSPLRGHEPALAACLGRQDHTSGVLVVDLSFAPAGAVTQAIAHGTTSQATRNCIAAAVQQITRSEAGPPRQRCSLAFGALPLAGAPGVELTPDAIQWDGTPVARPADHAADGGATATIPPLVAAAQPFAQPFTDAVAIRGPVMLRPHDATPMHLVNLAARSLHAAGIEDVVYAAQDGAGWRALARDLELPVVPVPVGTGERWYGRARGMQHALAMRVDPDGVWLVLSQSGEAQHIPANAGALDGVALEQALRAHKASAAFADRADLELAGSGAVPYRTVLDALARAAAAGFGDAVLMTPEAQSARPER
ncbi:MAG: hypothetical protein M3680_35610, partial [Myxococcota bacterium]|nr:hypothetical protein [Myxococcota bacterium]